MRRKPPFRTLHAKAFSFSVFAFFLVQLFSPFAFAQAPALAPPETNPSIEPATPTPSPTPSPTLPPGAATPAPAPSTPVAAGRTPSSIGVCTISEFSPGEWDRFRRAVFNFEGHEVTDKSDAKLREEKPGTNVVVNNYNFPVEESLTNVPIADVARLLRRSPESVVEELGIDDDKDAQGNVVKPAAQKEITLAQAAIVAPKDSKGQNALAQLRQTFQRRKQEVESPGFESMKVTLPSGREVPLSEFYKLQKFQQTRGQNDACLLGSAYLRGRIETVSLLDQDLLIGADKASSTLLHEACGERECQHLTTDSIRASVTNYDGNLVLQSFYEKAVAAIGSWFFWDFLFSSMIAISSARDLQIAKRNLESSDRYSEMMSKRGIERAFSKADDDPLTRDVEKYIQSEYTSKFGSSRVGREALLDFIPAVDQEFVQVKKNLARLPAREEDLKNGEEEIALLQKKIRDSTTPQGEIASLTHYLETAEQAHAEVVQDVTQLRTLKGAFEKHFGNVNPDVVDIQFAFRTQKSREDQIKLLEDTGVISPGKGGLIQDRGEFFGLPTRLKRENFEAEFSDRLASFGHRRAWSNFMLGATWLGPGRVGLELASQILVTSATDPQQERGDSLLVYINNGEFLRTFRKTTDFFNFGRFLETISEFIPISVPYKAFVTGPMIAVQSPGSGSVERTSITSIEFIDGRWQLSTNWKGDSDLTLFEDIRDGKTWTSVGFRTNYLRFSSSFNRKKELQAYYHGLLLLAPLVSWRVFGVKDIPQGLVTLVQLQLLEFYLDNVIDPLSFNPSEVCSQEKLDGYVNGYKTFVALTLAEQTLFFTKFGIQQWSNLGAYIESRKLQEFAKPYALTNHFIELYRHIQVVDPLIWGKATLANMAIEYSLSCKDPSYKVIAYQKIPEKTTKANALAKIRKKTTDPLGINEVVKNLNIGKAFSGVGQKINAAELKDILNIKSLQRNQNGLLKPAEIYHLQLDPEGSDLQWYAPFESQCLRNCLQQADGTFVCATNEGFYAEKNGNRVQLADREHAIMTDFIPSIGLVVPNKIISAPLNCKPEKAVFEARPDASLHMVDGSCPAADCALKSLVAVSGLNIAGSDLSKVMGPVEAIYTTQGVATLDGSEYRFVRTKGVRVTDQTLLGKKERVEGEAKEEGKDTILHKEESLAGTEQRFKSVKVMGDGKVRANPEIGELLTIQMQNGVIHFDRSSRKLYVLVKVLAEAPARDITGMTISPASVPGPKAQLEREASELQALRDALASGARLSQAQLELLRKVLEKPAQVSQLLTDTERELLRQALEKQRSNIPLSQAEKDLIEKSQKEEKFPGVIVLLPRSVERIERILKDQNVDAATTKGIVDKLSAGQPITLDEKKKADEALEKEEKQGKISGGEASTVRTELEKALTPAARAEEIIKAMEENKLTPEQRQIAELAAARDARAAQAAASTASDRPLQAIQFGGATAKVGAEESAQALNRALERVGPMTDIKTEKSVVQIDRNAAGEEVVRIGNKETGTATEHKITGAITRDPTTGGLTIPTADGPVKIDLKINPDTGAPVITLNGPGGLRDISQLVEAAGPGGTLFFDPKTGTWQVRNGFAAGADDSFAKNGITFAGGPDGTRGIPEQPRFGNPQPQSGGVASGYNPLLSLPSWPEDNFYGILVLLLIIAGVFAARLKIAREDS